VNEKQDPSLWAWLLSLRHHRVITLLTPVIGAAMVGVHYVAVKDIVISVAASRGLWLLYLTQAAMVLAVMAVIELGPQPRTYPQLYPRGSRALDQFWEVWPKVWIAWFILYAALAALRSKSLDWLPQLGPKLEGQPIPPLAVIVPVALHFINNLATIALLRCFYVLAEPTFPSQQYPPEGDILKREDLESGIRGGPEAHHVPVRRHGHIWFAAALGVSALECFLVLPGALRDVPATTTQISALQNTLQVFGIAYGVLAATATALIVGQLDTKLMGVPFIALLTLFGYAAIQPSFDFIFTNTSEPIIRVSQAVIVALALVCKLLLFAVFQWLALTNRLLYFLVQNYTLHVGVPANRSRFLERLQLGRQGPVIVPYPRNPQEEEEISGQ